MTLDPRDVPPGSPPPPYPVQSSSGPVGTTSTGLDPKLSGLLAYLFGAVSGILFLLAEKRHPEVRFHAAQSILLTVALVVLSVVLSILSNIPVLGWVFAILGGLIFMFGALIVWLFMMYKGYQLEHFKLPLIGDYAEKLAGKVV
ncbi:MAG: DUF4870 domain-containing protein [Gemmatimonadetes bacterium]|nr:DUF4870 domain-containing protein [Gemmatimonadota bacterium]